MKGTSWLFVCKGTHCTNAVAYSTATYLVTLCLQSPRYVVAQVGGKNQTARYTEQATGPAGSDGSQISDLDTA